jgi:predicted transcriptional regulator
VKAARYGIWIINTLTPFGEEVKIRLIRLGKTQVWLARQIGISKFTLSRVMRGESASPEMIYRIKKFLEAAGIEQKKLIIRREYMTNVAMKSEIKSLKRRVKALEKRVPLQVAVKKPGEIIGGIAAEEITEGQAPAEGQEDAVTPE